MQISNKHQSTADADGNVILHVFYPPFAFQRSNTRPMVPIAAFWDFRPKASHKLFSSQLDGEHK